MGLCAITFLILLVLNLTGVIAIAWFWVFMPLVLLVFLWFLVILGIVFQLFK